MTELAARYGLSPKTGYKWLERYAVEGALGLRDRSRQPHTSPRPTAPALVEALVAVRRRHPQLARRNCCDGGSPGSGRAVARPLDGA